MQDMHMLHRYVDHITASITAPAVEAAGPAAAGASAAPAAATAAADTPAGSGVERASTLQLLALKASFETHFDRK